MRFSTLLLSVFFSFFICISFSFACGGGVVPYIPTQSGASNQQSTEFFILEKGVAAELFNVKKLQPLFRNIILNGNERKKRKNQKEMGMDSTELSALNKPDTLHVHSHVPKTTGNSVLNLHRIH